MFAAASVLFACGGIKDTQDVSHLNKLQGKVTASEYLRECYADEWKLMPQTTCRNDNNAIDGIPSFGIALSGGGTRSASFCIGILKGLEENNLLREAQVLSTVSGGSYAGYWYFSQQYYMDKDTVKGMKIPEFLKYETKDIFKSADLFTSVCTDNDTQFKDCLVGSGEVCPDPGSQFEDCVLCKKKRNHSKYRFQRHLEDRSDIAVRSVYKPLQYLDYSLKIVTYIPSIFVSTFTELLFNWDLNVNPLRRYYQHGLERTYGFVPMEKIRNSCLATDVEKNKKENNFQTTYFANDKTLIFPRAHAVNITFPELLEFTKRRNQQSDLTDNDRPFPFWIINTTANVVDDNGDDIKDLSQRVFEFTPIGFGSNHFGYVKESHPSIDIPKAVSISGAAVDHSGVHPFIGWFMDVLNVDLGYNINNYSNYVENNFLQKALPFPFYFWSNYEKNNKHHSIHLSDGGHGENLGAFSLIKRGVKNILIVDAEYDPEMALQGLKRLARRLKKIENLNLVEVDPIPVNYSPIDADTHQVFKYKVNGFPFKKKDGAEYEINITYVKLSVNRNDILSLHDKAQILNRHKYYSLINYMNKSEHKNKFPHHSTGDIQYSKYQVAAYRDLGYFIAKEQLTEDKIFDQLSTDDHN